MGCEQPKPGYGETLYPAETKRVPYVPRLYQMKTASLDFSIWLVFRGTRGLARPKPTRYRPFYEVTDDFNMV